MRTPIVLSILLLPCLLGCRPVLYQAQTITWLDSKTGAAEVDLSGDWESPLAYTNGGWGWGPFVQSGPNLSGTLGLYSVHGRVAGKQLYATLIWNSHVYYTGVLDCSKDGEITGTLVAGAIADEPTARSAEHVPIHLVRMKQKQS